MDDWLARYAAALAHGLPEGAAEVDLGEGGDQVVRQLFAAVEAAAGTDTAALAGFLAGVYTALKASAGEDAAAAVTEALRVARRMATA